jgi:hypothetical protein
VTHPWTSQDIARLRHEERLALGHAAMHSLEARKARSTKPKTDGVQSTSSWLNRIRRRESATPQAPARSGTS